MFSLDLVDPGSEFGLLFWSGYIFSGDLFLASISSEVGEAARNGQMKGGWLRFPIWLNENREEANWIPPP